MAKKKVTRQAEDHKEEAAQPQDQSQTHQSKPMDEPSEKLEKSVVLFGRPRWLKLRLGLIGWRERRVRLRKRG
jgi:hypothetical protein